jgi:hypothetical protein
MQPLRLLQPLIKADLPYVGARMLHAGGEAVALPGSNLRTVDQAIEQVRSMPTLGAHALRAHVGGRYDVVPVVREANAWDHDPVHAIHLLGYRNQVGGMTRVDDSVVALFEDGEVLDLRKLS